MLGIGIFIAPPVVAGHVGHPGPFLALWLAGGLAALFGALSVAELGALMPRAGGDYPYLRAAYGPGFAFAAGWLQLLAIFPGSLATSAVGTARFQLPVLFGEWLREPMVLAGLEIEPATVVAIGMVLGLTALNHVGIVISGRVQVALSGVPIFVLFAVSIGVMIWDGGSGGAWSTDAAHGPTFGAESVALAYLAVYFAYSGWNAAIYIGAEVRDPGRNLPRALIGGTAAVTVLYVVLCGGYLTVFDVPALAKTGEAGTASAGQLFGTAGQVGVTGLIFLAMLGCLNGTVMAGSRVGYAMALEGHCVPAAGRVHRRFGTPVVALWMQAGWTVVLIASSRFDQLMAYTSSAMLVTGTLTALSVLVLRRRMPGAERPYRVALYPWPPVLYAISSVVVLGVLAARGDLSVFLGLVWFVGALAVHAVFLRRRDRAAGGV